MEKTQKKLQLISCDDRLYSLKNIKSNKNEGSISSIEPEISSLITLYNDQEEDILAPVKDPKFPVTKIDSCCDGKIEDPICGIGDASLSADFSKLKIEVLAFHKCGIRQIGAAIATVTIIAPGKRKLDYLYVNGRPNGDGKEFPCPSGEDLRIHTLEFPTSQLRGFRFAAKVFVASCCDRQHLDDTVKSSCRIDSRTFFIT